MNDFTITAAQVKGDWGDEGRLSAAQKQIVAILFWYHRAIKGEHEPHRAAAAEALGIPLILLNRMLRLVFSANWSAATLSRSRRRLAERGLLVQNTLVNGMVHPKGRTTHIAVTVATLTNATIYAQAEIGRIVNFFGNVDDKAE